MINFQIKTIFKLDIGIKQMVKEKVDDEPVNMKTKWREVVTECNIVLCLIAAFSLIFLAVKNILTS